ncbi:hypothetical protein MAHJHV61_33170 [Mycobacterium avium subsp. hominissuis]
MVWRTTTPNAQLQDTAPTDGSARLRMAPANQHKDEEHAVTASTDHADIWAYESASCEPTPWESWIDAVESALGHDPDGDQAVDGYSLDGFYDMWKKGLTPSEAASSVPAR